MKAKTLQTITLSFAFFATLLFLVPVTSFAATDNSTEITENADVQLVEGKIKRYNQEQQIVLLQLRSGDRITVYVDWNTSLIGYSSPQEIEKKHKVKIWYSDNGQQLMAVKIEKKLMVGC